MTSVRIECVSLLPLQKEEGKSMQIYLERDNVFPKYFVKDVDFAWNNYTKNFVIPGDLLQLFYPLYFYKNNSSSPFFQNRPCFLYLSDMYKHLAYLGMLLRMKNYHKNTSSCSSCLVCLLSLITNQVSYDHWCQMTSSGHAKMFKNPNWRRITFKARYYGLVL